MDGIFVFDPLKFKQTEMRQNKYFVLKGMRYNLNSDHETHSELSSGFEFRSKSGIKREPMLMLKSTSTLPPAECMQLVHGPLRSVSASATTA